MLSSAISGHATFTTSGIAYAHQASGTQSTCRASIAGVSSLRGTLSCSQGLRSVRGGSLHGLATIVRPTVGCAQNPVWSATARHGESLGIVASDF